MDQLHHMPNNHNGAALRSKASGLEGSQSNFALPTSLTPTNGNRSIVSLSTSPATAIAAATITSRFYVPSPTTAGSLPHATAAANGNRSGSTINRYSVDGSVGVPPSAASTPTFNFRGSAPVAPSSIISTTKGANGSTVNVTPTIPSSAASSRNITTTTGGVESKYQATTTSVPESPTTSESVATPFSNNNTTDEAMRASPQLGDPIGGPGGGVVSGLLPNRPPSNSGVVHGVETRFRMPTPLPSSASAPLAASPSGAAAVAVLNP
jgi:hypothetical protein